MPSETVVILNNILGIIALAAVCLSWHHFARKMATSPCISSCTDDDTNKRIKGSSSLSLWLSILSVLMTLALVGGLVYRAYQTREGAQDPQA